MKKLFFITLSIMSFIYQLYAQGCVAIRSTGGICTMNQHDSSKWQLNLNNRYFKSYKHFVGTDYQPQREQLGNNVINHAYTLDITVTRKLNERWSMMLDVPIISNERSSLYEHSNVGRYSTHAFGVGDIRIAVYDWVIDPVKMPRANLQVGLGLKLPTGNYNYQDYFMLTDSTKRLGPVDQSIQLGDGGTGITVELNGFYNFSHQLNAYANFYYLSNPREQNGVSTARGGTPSATQVKNGSDVMSVPDQMMIRAGVNYTMQHFTFSLGMRDECLPVHDVIGGSNGFRRPGYIISAEPGVTYTKRKFSIYAYLPYAIVRCRTQSVPDKITTALTGKYTQGDAAFADYVMNIGCSIKL